MGIIESSKCTFCTEDDDVIKMSDTEIILCNDNDDKLLSTVILATKKEMYQYRLRNKNTYLDIVKYNSWCLIQAKSFSSITSDIQDF